MTKLVQETPRVASLVLKMPDWHGHLAGQHVDVRVTAEDGYQAERSYSIASPPEDPQLAITVERLDDGEVSPYLVGEVRAGDKVELRGPIGGYFVWKGGDERPLLLVAGGSGIAPLMAMIRHRAAVGSKTPTRLLYSSRSLEDVIYKAELDRLASAGDGLTVAHALTRKQPEGWAGYSRRIDTAMLAEVAWPKSQAPIVYVCGPTPLVESVATLLVDVGYDPASIKTERFGPTGG
ncbi:MAG TPA: ferredoxin reductase [Candidatus Dormibacteraeota bacterium]|nr:ferredoxin reductase [Candidatus Dormibacteraeota bacterium]